MRAAEILAGVLGDTLNHLTPRRRDRKANLEAVVRAEHPRWPNSRIGSEAGRRLREQERGNDGSAERE